MSYSENKYYTRLVGILLALFFTGACSIGGMGWDDKRDIEIAKQFPPTRSTRIRVTVEKVPFQTFRQEFDNAFEDFPYSGPSVGPWAERIQTQILETPYSVEYANFVIKISRDNRVISERVLPTIFYMHPVSCGAVLSSSASNDRVICRTYSRATTGLHYLLVIDGDGDILFESVLRASEDWCVLPGPAGEIILGGAQSKIVISEVDKENGAR